jgi:hypothetical protein
MTMMKGDNVTEQIPLPTQPDDNQQDPHWGLFRDAGLDTEDHPSAAQSTVAAPPSQDLFSHASEYDVADQQRPATPHSDDMTPRSFQPPFEAETDPADALDQQRPVPADDDDYR